MSAQFLVVGIGASAGGVEALQQFFARVPPASGCAYVVILHLSPEHESHLAELLQRVATIPVSLVSEPVQVVPNQVYVVPPNRHLTMADSELVVSPNLHLEDRRMPIDIFFRTLAESQAERAVCVVLSGAGADGALGLKRIKERGGAAFVQDVAEAAWSEMPRNAISTGLVDAVLPVADIPARIMAYRDALNTVRIPLEPKERAEEQQRALRELFALLRTHIGHDFTDYKRPTLLRRIERRISVLGLPDLPSYTAFLREHTEEIALLLKNLLISVTAFFRDREAFTALEQDIIPRIFAGKGADDLVRLWVVGCATGEEAYSLAMLCAEHAMDALDAPIVQIFATDIDETAIARAREGLYLASDVADITPERLRRFFVKEEDRYRVRRELRESILFAVHNILKDPPFSHLDLVSCRNVLIYLNRTAQQRALETIHFALNPDGYLFLGSAEAAEGHTDLFVTFSREHHLYQRHPVRSQSLPLPLPALRPPLRLLPTATAPLAPELSPPPAREQPIPIEIHQRLLEQYAPPSLIVTTEYMIVHVSPGAARYLKVGAGEPTTNLLLLVRPELRGVLHAALSQAVQRRITVDTAPTALRIDEREEHVTIRVRPVFPADAPAQGFVLILFEADALPLPAAEVTISATEPATRLLEAEVLRLKQELRTSGMQYEYQAEKLKSTNEELQALNEELRSSTEELETSKEELQSVNEELHTVNQELKIKIEEASLHSTNLQNLLTSAEVGTIFLDRELQIKLFTPAARTLFNLIAGDHDRPLADITHRMVGQDVIADAEHVLRSFQTIEREVRTIDGEAYLLRILPYRAGEDRIGGVVLTFFDITALQHAEAALRESERRLQLALEAAEMGTFLWHVAEDRGEPDAQMLALFGLPPDSTLTLRDALATLIHSDDRAGYAADVARACDPAGDGRLRSDIRVIRPDGTERWIAITAQVHFTGTPLQPTRMYGAAFDITDRKHVEEALRQNRERQAYLLALSDVLRPLLDPVDIQATVTDTAMRYFNADRCYYCEIEQGNAIILRDSARDGLPSVVGTYPLGSMPIFQAIVNAGRPFVVRDAHISDILDEQLRQLCIRMQVISFMDVPVIKNGRPIGILCITQGTPREWTAFEVELAVETAERTWAAVERARIETALRESEVKYRTIFTSIDEGFVICELLYDEAGQPFDLLVLETNPSFERMMRTTDAVGKRANAIFPDAEASWFNAYGSVIETGTSLRLQNHFAALDRWFELYISRIGGAGSRYFAIVFHDITERKQAEAQVQAALEAERGARRAAERASERTAQLQALTAGLADALTREDIIRVITEHGIGTTGATGAVIDLLDPSGERLEVAGLVGRAGAMAWPLLPPDVSAPPAVVAHSGEPIWLASREDAALRFPGLQDVLAHFDDHALATLPLRTADQVIGTLSFLYAAPHNFIAEEQDFLLALAQQCAQAFERARLYAAIVESRQQLRQLSHRLLDVQEAERSHLARELHDELGQELTGLRLALELAGRVPVEQRDPHLTEVRRTVQELIARVRDLSLDLRPVMLDDAGLLPALIWMLRRFQERTGIAVEFHHQGIERRLPPTVETVAYRVVQEALTNIARHAEVAAATVNVLGSESQLFVQIQDQGRGFEFHTQIGNRNSSGLAGMQERVQLLGGTLNIETAPGEGTCLTVELPLQSTE